MRPHPIVYAVLASLAMWALIIWGLHGLFHAITDTLPCG